MTTDEKTAQPGAGTTDKLGFNRSAAPPEHSVTLEHTTASERSTSSEHAACITVPLATDTAPSNQKAGSTPQAGSNPKSEPNSDSCLTLDSAPTEHPAAAPPTLEPPAAQLQAPLSPAAQLQAPESQVSAPASRDELIWQVKQSTSAHALAQAQVQLRTQHDVLNTEQNARVGQVQDFALDSPQYVQTLTAQAAQASAEQRARQISIEAPWANVYHHTRSGQTRSSSPLKSQSSPNLMGPGQDVLALGADLGAQLGSGFSTPQAEHAAAISPKVKPDFAYRPDRNTDLESPDSVSFYETVEHVVPDAPLAQNNSEFAQHCSEELMASLHYLQLNQALQHIFYPQSFSSPIPWEQYHARNDSARAPTEAARSGEHHAAYAERTATHAERNAAVQREAMALFDQTRMGSFVSMVGAAGRSTKANPSAPQSDPSAAQPVPSAARAASTVTASAVAGNAAASADDRGALGPVASVRASEASSATADAAQTAAALSHMALGLEPEPKSDDALTQASLSAVQHALGLEDNKDLSRADLARGIANLEHSMAVLLSMLGCGVMIQAVGGGHQRKVIWANDAMYQIYGYSPEEFDRISSDSSLPQIIHPADINVFFANFERVHDASDPIHFEYRILNGKTKHYVWCDMRSAYIGELGTMSLFICLVSDITAEKHEKDRTERWIRKSALLSEACQELVFEYDYNTDTFERFGNYQNFVRADNRIQHHFLQNLPLKENIHPDDKHYFSALLRDTSLATSNKRRMVKFRLRPINGTEFLWHMCSAIGYTEESTGHVKIIGKVANIHQYETRLATLHQENQRDPMTKLYNKIAMEQLSRKVLQDKTNQRHALLMIDIDNFKQVNDSCGHAFGDEVIKMIAHCLAHTFRSSDLVARVGGDEFTVLLQNVTFDQAVALSEIYHRIVAEQTQKLSRPYHITSSVGIAFCPDDASGYDGLYHAADQALYWVKNNCKGAIALYSNAQIAAHTPNLNPDLSSIPCHLRPHTKPSLSPDGPVDRPSFEAEQFKDLDPAAIAAVIGVAGVTKTHFAHEDERMEHSLHAIADELEPSEDEPC